MKLLYRGIQDAQKMIFKLIFITFLLYFAKILVRNEIMQDISLMKNSFENRTYKKHFHNTYSISLITDGECVFCKDQSKYKAKKGDVRVINPYEVHEIHSSSWEHTNLVLSAYFVRCVAKNFKDINIGFKTITDVTII